jgi:hypothetical protein
MADAGKVSTAIGSKDDSNESGGLVVAVRRNDMNMVVNLVEHYAYSASEADDGGHPCLHYGSISSAEQ